MCLCVEGAPEGVDEEKEKQKHREREREGEKTRRERLRGERREGGQRKVEGDRRK